MVKRNIRQITGVVMAAVFLATIAGSAGASAASGSISEAQKRKTQLENDLNDAQALIEQLQDQEGDIQEAVRELDDRLTVISGNIDALEVQTRQKNKELLDTQNQLAAARADESEQYESMKVRIRYMYQNSGISYLEALLESGSFAKMLKQVDYMSTMMQYDRAKLEEYQQTQALIQNAEETIRKDKADLEALQAQLEEEQQAVNLLMQEKETQLSGVRQGISEAEQNAQQYQQEIEAENQLIQEMLAAEAAEEKKRQEEQQKQQESQKNNASSGSNVDTNDVYEGGVFTWPCPSSRKITSGFGYRDKPTAGATSYHQGYDIGASAGAAIVAAADGVVTSTGYSSVLGNYVILSHGGGLFTIYEHCSAVLVSQGQSVSRGSTIAKVGSTGVSTGPHLHFGVQLNGKYVDPGNYLKG
ncbi:murein hydrolase activator EnvC [uncultured Eubacterium sp.]|uniref:murein hydrolase activator EnvC family protein n=1 Tax=uncultured Eubacterium sp. TaxID=165185 RepID=UPI002598DCAB|nr:M23 family metallopeptidase [uncultured Eubacterium sp.]